MAWKGSSRLPEPVRAFQVGVGLAAAWTLAASAGVCEPLERLTAQARYLLRPAPVWDAPVTIVAIDEASLVRLGQMPWPRTTFARLLDKLREGGARVVGVDVAFNEPSRDPAEDRVLAAAMRRIPTVLPTFRAYADTADSPTALETPIAPFREAAVAYGSAQPTSYQQRETWELELFQTWRSGGAPIAGQPDRGSASFPMLVASAYRGEPISLSPSWLWENAPRYINFRGPANSAPRISAADVLAAPGAPGGLKGRIALVGATAIGFPDTNFIVPDLRGGPMPGVEISAHAIDNLLADRFLRRVSPPVLALLMLSLAAFPGRWLLADEALGRRRLRTLALASVAWTACVVAAFQLGIWLELVPVLGFFATAYLGGLLAERAALMRGRAQLLERYASDLGAEARRQRERIEGELHDGVQQLLIAMGRELRQARRNLHVPERVEARIERMEDIADQMLGEIQRVRRDLMPPALRRAGLEGAIAAYAEELSTRDGLQVVLERDGWERLDAELETELYWMAREAITNAAKHAAPGAITVRLAREAGQALVEVSDDGNGFTPPDLSVPPSGIENSGLHRMWLRMRGRHGDLAITSSPGGGSCLRFTLPLGQARGQADLERRGTR